MNDTDDREKKKTQPALTIQEQIENLKELGLEVSDITSASEFLNDVSYYRFIKAYSLGIKQKNGNYYHGVSFEQLMELYCFNTLFRQLLFTRIEDIEINLRCRLANYFSLKYGPMGYLNECNFENYPQKFSQEIKEAINRNTRSPFIQNFQQNYENGNVPFYAVVEILSFGTLSKFFKNMVTEDKKAIAEGNYGVNYKHLESWIESIAYIRNVCAHYGRLYNIKLTKKPLLYKEIREKGITNDRVMGVLMCMKDLLPNKKRWNSFVEVLEQLIKAYPAVRIETMGFPSDWKSLLLY